MAKQGYVGASLPNELVEKLNKIGENELAPIGVKVTPVAVINYLVATYEGKS